MNYNFHSVTIVILNLMCLIMILALIFLFRYCYASSQEYPAFYLWDEECSAAISGVASCTNQVSPPIRHKTIFFFYQKCTGIWWRIWECTLFILKTQASYLKFIQGCVSFVIEWIRGDSYCEWMPRVRNNYILMPNLCRDKFIRS